MNEDEDRECKQKFLELLGLTEQELSELSEKGII